MTTDRIPSSPPRGRSFDVPRILAWVAVIATSVVLWLVALAAVTALI